ncbi:cell division protein FtsQ [Rossellomorea vietnamensis]|uniref:Cell division protein FtsQ n=1 Tax=Rossellomorea vietnamensis TaxID=218284 RepID=A0A5D4M7Q3_9BACI|nr:MULTISPECIES: cell division protein FtsQ [Bacillaceae]TYR97393.1 cell division protein FtsQ [Rossellomorea vietnamensis]
MNNLRSQQLSQSQKLMVFILSMSLFGIANIITEITPEIVIGPVELSVSYFAFVPLTMVFLFSPLHAALGAPLGEIIFADLLMGDFGGIGELEGFIEFGLGMYVAGLLVKDPTNRKQLALGALIGVGIDQMLSTIVDIGKVWFGIEELEAVPGIAESILVLEGISFTTEMLISGVLFGLIPALWLVPKLYGKIEPLMGFEPRNPQTFKSSNEVINVKFIILAVFFAFVAMISEFLATLDVNFAVWEPDFIDQFGMQFLWIGVSAAVIVLLVAILGITKMVKKQNRIEHKKGA